MTGVGRSQTLRVEAAGEQGSGERTGKARRQGKRGREDKVPPEREVEGKEERGELLVDYSISERQSATSIKISNTQAL